MRTRNSIKVLRQFIASGISARYHQDCFYDAMHHLEAALDRAKKAEALKRDGKKEDPRTGAIPGE